MNVLKPFSIVTAVLLATMMLVPATALAQEEAAGQQVRIHTVLEETNEPFHDACYQLEDFSDIVCDEDSDGTVTFEDVPAGEYSLVQTADLGGLHPIGAPGVDLANLTVYEDDINDYDITLIDAGEDTDLGLITRDPESGAVIEGACYELAGYSNVGCDDDGDGIVMFEAIPWGTHTVHQTETPEGHDPMGDYEISLQPFQEAGNGPVIIPLLQAEEQGNENATNISVLVVDEESGDRVANEETCLEFPGMTNTACDDDVTDGQVDFMGVDPTFGQPTFDVISLACGFEAEAANNVIMQQYGEHHVALVMNVSVIPVDCPN